MNKEIEALVWKVLHQLPRGRVTTWFPVAHLMMEYVAKAGPGDHLEIGVLHGGTAIMSALTKKAMGHAGKIVALDPFDGYYPASPTKPNGVVSERGQRLTAKFDNTGVPITVETFKDNIEFFNVADNIEIVKAFSVPWPLGPRRFVSAYIDGDHYGDGPTLDWNNVKQAIQPGGYVWFDDCNDNCPGVLKAAELAAAEPGWTKIGLFHKQTFIVRKDDN
ncbi:MAG: class I SAM-dependent methyltransferase [bacterium]